VIISLSNIDAYYINLESDKIKKISTENTLKNIGFNSINRVDAVKNNDHKRFGIVDSFVKTLKLAKENDKYPFAIFEDDVVSYKEYKDIDVPDNIDALYVGTSPWGFVPEEALGIYDSISAELLRGDVYKIYNMLSAHGIIYFSKIYVDFLINSLPKAIEYKCNQDIIRAQSQKFFNVYALDMPLVYQSDTEETKMSMSSLNLINPNGFSYMQSYTFDSWDGRMNE